MDRGVKRFNPWKRQSEPNPFFDDEDWNNLEKWPSFRSREENRYLNLETKRATLKASNFVVAIESYIGEEELRKGSGIILESDEYNKGFVITSAHLIRKPTDEHIAENLLATNFRLVIINSVGKCFEGELFLYDFHYNIAVVVFYSDLPLQTATLKQIDDSFNLNPSFSVSEETSFQLRVHSDFSKLLPGDDIIAVGRYFSKPYSIMAAPGKFSLESCGYYECKELLSATCKITKCGDGGPIINVSGEVIGIAFHDVCFAPFLPINIVCKWWENYKKYRILRRPNLGVEMANFYSIRLDRAEPIIRQFPNISQAVIVERVIASDTAESARLRVNDVVIQIGGKQVYSLLKLWEMIWDHVGQNVELVVARVGHTTPLHLNMTIDETAEGKLYSWPDWKG